MKRLDSKQRNNHHDTDVEQGYLKRGPKEKSKTGEMMRMGNGKKADGRGVEDSREDGRARNGQEEREEEEMFGLTEEAKPQRDQPA